MKKIFFKHGLDDSDRPIVEVRNEAGELLIVLTESDATTMEVGGLDPFNEDDMVEYVNHLLSTKFVEWEPVF